MKRLDEVIEKLEFATRVSFGCVLAKNVEVDDLTDVLHYLKEYRDDRKHYAEAISNCGKALNQYIMDIQALAQQEDNQPLTWDELKGMEGKPVWVEGRTMDDHDGDYKYWCIVGKTDKLDTYIHLREHGYHHWKSTYGDWWQAYRKERE